MLVPGNKNYEKNIHDDNHIRKNIFRKIIMLKRTIMTTIIIMTVIEGTSSQKQ